MSWCRAKVVDEQVDGDRLRKGFWIDLVGGDARLTSAMMVSFCILAMATLMAPQLATGLPCFATRYVDMDFVESSNKIEPLQLLVNSSAVFPVNEYQTSNGQAGILSSLATFHIARFILSGFGNSPHHSSLWALPSFALSSVYLFVESFDLRYCQSHCTDYGGARFEATPLSQCGRGDVSCVYRRLAETSCNEQVFATSYMDSYFNWAVYLAVWFDAAVMFCVLLVGGARALSGQPLRLDGGLCRVDLYRRHIIVPVRLVLGIVMALLLGLFVSIQTLHWANDRLSDLEEALDSLIGQQQPDSSPLQFLESSRDLANALQLATYVGLPTGIVFMLGTMAFNIWKIRGDVIELAAKRDGDESAKKDYSSAVLFLGAFVYNSFFVLWLVWFVVGLVVALFAWPTSRAIVASWWPWLVTVTLSSLTNVFLRWLFLTKWAGSTRHGMSRPRLWRFVDVIISLLSLFSGPALALYRIGCGLLAIVIMLPRIDVPLTPPPLEFLDWLHDYYIATLRLHRWQERLDASESHGSDDEQFKLLHVDNFDQEEEEEEEEEGDRDGDFDDQKDEEEPLLIDYK
jgi:hypothetical protein